MLARHCAVDSARLCVSIIGDPWWNYEAIKAKSVWYVHYFVRMFLQGC